MAIKVGNHIIASDNSSIIVDSIALGNAASVDTPLILVHDNNGKATLQNVDLDLGTITFQGSGDTGLTTDTVVEGNNNLYYTEARAYQSFNNFQQTNNIVSQNDLDNLESMLTSQYISYTDTAEANAILTANLYTDQQVQSNISSSLSSLTTDNIPEGNSNLYYDETRLAYYLNTQGYATLTAVAQGDQAVAAQAQSYTDTELAIQSSSITNAYRSYTDAGDAAVQSAASLDATAKANAAQSAAETTAAADASAKANAAQLAAEATASADATSKADAAQVAANTYTDTAVANLATESYVDQQDGLLLSNIQDEITARSNADTATLASANAYTDAKVADLVDTAPAALDTLNELAAALGDDANFATTVATDIGTKVSKAGDTMTGALTLSGAPTNALHAATKSYVDVAVSNVDTVVTGLTTDDITEGTNQYFTDARALTATQTAITTAQDTAKSEAIAESNQYTDDKEITITNALTANYEAYTDAAEASAISTSNLYTDNALTNALIKDVSGPQHWVDLGNNTALYWGTSDTNITGSSGLINMKPNGSGVASFETTGLVIDLLKDIRYQKNNNVYTKLSFAGTVNSSDHTITIPDATGTMALTSDIPVSTDDIPEGTNLYYTDARVDARIPNVFSGFGTRKNGGTTGSFYGWIEPNSVLEFRTNTPEVNLQTHGGNTNVYVDIDVDVSAILASANTYTDTAVANLATESYVDQQDGLLLSNIQDEIVARSNADTATLASANTYTDGEIVTALTSANSYTDTELAGAVAATITNANAYTDDKISDLVDTAPAALDTLNELAAALGDDPNFATTITNSIATKADSADLLTKVSKSGDTMTGNLSFGNNNKINLGTLDALQLYATGTNSLVYNNVGDLYFYNNVDDGSIIFRTDNSTGGTTNYIVANGATGSVELNHYGVKRLETTNTGVDITGILSVSATPTASTHVTTKQYVDNAISAGTGSLDSDSVPEGIVNLYYTDARVDARIPSNVSSFTNDSNYVTQFTLEQYMGDSSIDGTIGNTVINRINQAKQDAQDYADAAIPTGVGAFTNDVGYLTAHQSLVGYATEQYVDDELVTAVSATITNANAYTDNKVASISIPTNVSAFTNDAGYLTAHQSLSGYATESYVDQQDGLLLSNIQDEIVARSNADTATLASANTYTDTAISNLVNGASAAFDTLKEIQDAMATDAELSAAIAGLTIGNGTLTVAAGAGLTGGGNFTANQTGNTTRTLNVGGGNGITVSADGVAMSGSYTGTFTASGDVCAYSDRRFKHNIVTISDALSKVVALRGVNYDKQDKYSMGVIAQEVEEVVPEVVHTDAEGMKSVAYGNLVGLLIEAIKDQQKQIDDLKAEIDNLKK